LETALADFHQQNTELIAIAVQDQAGAQSTLDETQVSYPILIDPDHRIADSYGVYNLLGDGVATPSIFIINKAGQIVWSHVAQNISDRPDNATIMANLPAS
jgi:peroxiredoxin